MLAALLLQRRGRRTPRPPETEPGGLPPRRLQAPLVIRASSSVVGSVEVVAQLVGDVTVTAEVEK